MTLDTGHSLAEKGLLDGGVAFLLPTELTLQFGAVEINSEVVRNFVRSGASGWIYGALTEIELRTCLELLGDVHGERNDGEGGGWGVDVGGRQALTPRITCLRPQEVCVPRLTERSCARMWSSS
jgi:hypothetical protein